MSTFTLDTSGRVAGDHAGLTVWYEFDDLSPFAQGCVEALFASIEYPAAQDTRYLDKGFSDLSPEALAMILRDCELFLNRHPGWVTRGGGSLFWKGRHDQEERSSGSLFSDTLRDFPPLRVSLDDAGKVQLTALTSSEVE